MHSDVWKASGHVKNFHDPLIDNKTSKKRYRVDHLLEKQSNEIQIGDIKVIPEVDDSAKGISDELSKKIENLLEDIKLILEELNQVK